MDLVMEADDELVLLAEDRSVLPTHMPDDVQSLSTGGPWRRMSKALVRERQKIVTVEWCDHIGAALVELDGYGGPGTEVWIYSPMPTDNRTEFLESDECRRQKTPSNLTVKILILSDTHASNLRRCGTSLCPGWQMCQRCTRREL